MRFASVLWKVIVFAYWRHKASVSRSALSCGSFISKHTGMYKLFHLSNTRVIHFLHLHQCCYISRLSPWAKFPFRTPHDVSALHTLSEWWKNCVFLHRGQKGLPCALSLCGPWSFVSLDVSSLSDPCCYSIWHRSITRRDPVQTAALPDANNQGHAESKNTWACYLLTSASSIALGLSDSDHPQSLDF